MKLLNQKFRIFLALILLLASTNGLCDSQREIKNSLIAQITSLKPANVEANATVIEGFSDPVATKAWAQISGKIEVTGYATNVELASYLKAITDSSIGLVELRETNPANHNGRRLSHFVFHISVSMPENCKEVSGILAGDDLSFSRRACGPISFAVLSHMIYRDESGHPIWGIIDSVRMPILRESESFTDVDCSYKLKKPQNDSFALIAIVGPYIKTKDDLYKTKVTYAIRPNLKTQKLNVLDPSTVSCDYRDGEDQD